jgi:hypothetical protein
MTRDELLAFKQRWRLVEGREIEELRAATPEHKLRQVAALMASVDVMGWREKLADELPVWMRWQKLRERLETVSTCRSNKILIEIALREQQ